MKEYLVGFSKVNKDTPIPVWITMKKYKEWCKEFGKKTYKLYKTTRDVNLKTGEIKWNQ